MNRVFDKDESRLLGLFYRADMMCIDRDILIDFG